MNDLLPDEQVLFTTKKHYIIFFTPVFLTILTFFFYLNSNPYVVNIALLPAIATLISWINELLNYYFSEFVVTTKRVTLREGFFFKHVNEARLSTIANITVNQSLLGQLLNYGTVFINTFGGESDPFSQIAHPVEFQKTVRAQLDKIVK